MMNCAENEFTTALLDRFEWKQSLDFYKTQRDNILNSTETSELIDDSYELEQLNHIIGELESHPC